MIRRLFRQKSWVVIIIVGLIVNILTDVNITYSDINGESNIQKPEIYVQLGHGTSISSVAVSPDSKFALTGSVDNNIKLWSLSPIRLLKTFSGHGDAIVSLDFSPDGKYALSGGGKVIKLWDVEKGAIVRSFKGHSETVTSAVFSPSGKYILSGGFDKQMKLWDIATGTQLKNFKRLEKYISSVSFSPDGRYALSCGLDDVKLWDIESGDELKAFDIGNIKYPAPPSYFYKTTFSSDGKYAIAVGNYIAVWKISNGRLAWKADSIGNVFNMTSVAFVGNTPDGNSILTFQKTKTEAFIKKWDITTGEQILSFQGELKNVYSAAMASNGKFLLTGTGDTWGIGRIAMKMHNVETGKEIEEYQDLSSLVSKVRFLRDGSYGVSANYFNHTLTIWDLANATVAHTVSGHSDKIVDMDVSPDGNKILSSSADKTVRLWDFSTGRQLAAFPVADQHAMVAFSKDGKHLAICENNRVRIIKADSEEEVRSLENHTKAIRAVEFSHDGKFIITGSTDQTLKVWDIYSGQELITLNGHSAKIFSLSISPDDSTVLSGDDEGNIFLWDIKLGRMLKKYKINGRAGNLKWTRNGQSFIAGTADGFLVLWDVRTGEKTKLFRGHFGAIHCADISSDGKYMLSGGMDTTTRLWDMITGKELAQYISYKNNEWIVITPEGYFAASKNGTDKINVKQDNRVFGLDQFYDVFYRPDIVMAKLKGEDITAMASINLYEALKNPPPSVEFVNVPSESADSKITIKYRITSNGGGIGEVRLFHNGKLIQSDGFYRQANTATTKQTTLVTYNTRAIKDELRGIALSAKKGNKLSLIESTPKGDNYEGVITVDAISGENDIGLAAFNKNNTVQSILKTATFKSTLTPEEPHLYVFSVGIDEYKSKKDNLKYAVKDAEGISAKIREQSITHYKPNNIHVEFINNDKAIKNRIMGKLDELTKVIRPNDVFILFIASHGVFQSGLYSVVTHDYDGFLTRDKLIDSSDIMEISKKMKALTQIFILDTCHAGGLDNFISGLYDARMTVMARNMGLHMFASASSTQEALDGYKGKNGMFTYTLLEGLNNNRAADTNKDGNISIYELGSYAKDQTLKLSKEMGHTQTPLINNFGKDISVYVIK